MSLNADVTPREVQYQIIQGILNNEEKDQWFVYLSQGLGKTLLSVYMIPYFNMKTLIMCYNVKILRQWVRTMTENTDIYGPSIILIDTGEILKRIESGDFPVWRYDVFMCTPKLLTEYGKKHGFEHLNILFDKMGIGLKIFDEAHRNIANIVKINAYTSVKKTLYLSGDFAQSNKIKEEMYYRMFHNVPVLRPTEELMNTLKFTVAVVVFYDSHPSELEKTSVYSKRGFSFYEYMKYEIQKKAFFDTLWYILDAINKTNKKNYKILVLVNLIEHVDTVKNEIEGRYGNRYIVGRYHSGVPADEKDFCTEEANLIVSTYQSFSVGIDVSLIKYVISCSICTKIDDNQASGRARPLPDNSDAYYFMMSDLGFSYTKEKLGSRLKYLKETKIKAIQRIRYYEE
jgi:superfamily II DNA or RNA helicase